MPASSYQLLVGGSPAPEALQSALGSIEVEENLDMPGAILLKLPVSRSAESDLSFVNDAELGPYDIQTVTPSSSSAASCCSSRSSVNASRAE